MNAITNMGQEAPKAPAEKPADRVPNPDAETGVDAVDDDAALIAALTEEEPAPPNDDEDEIEFKGEKVKVPKAIAERVREFDKAANYKMMEAATERKKIEAERVTFAETQKTFQAVANEYAEIQSIDKQLEPYLKYTPQQWMAWSQEDAAAASQAQIGVTALQNQRAQLTNALHGKIQGLRETESKAQEVALAEGKKAVASAIKDWTPEKETALKSAATEHYKLPEHALRMIGTDVYVTSVLNDAIKYRQALAKAKATVKTADAATVIPPKPVPKVGGTAAATKDPEKMNSDEWRKWRTSQIRQANAR